MNESDKRELENLKQRHKSIEHQLASLAGHIERLEAQITSSASSLTPEQPTPPSPTPVKVEPTPIATPPILPPPDSRSRLEDAQACPPPTPASEFIPDFLQ